MSVPPNAHDLHVFDGLRFAAERELIRDLGRQAARWAVQDGAGGQSSVISRVVVHVCIAPFGVVDVTKAGWAA